MENGDRRSQRPTWLEASGLPYILRTLGLAVHPAKLGLAFTGLFLTFVLGGMLDWAWTRAGGIHEDAVDTYITARHLDQPYVEPQGPYGVFKVFREHETACIRGFLGSSLPGATLASGTAIGQYVESHAVGGPLANLASAGHGVLWMARHHPVYFLIFGMATLIIWGWLGGAICRLAAVHFAKDEKLTLKQGLSYSRARLFGGFVLAPCIPLAFVLIIALVMVLGGLLLRVPILGDLVGGLLFGAAIFGGFLVAILLVGLLVGGSLFWPAVATEGSDAFDSFSRSLAYPFSKPWKAALYAILAVVFASLCWVLANLFTYMALAATRAIVGFGTAPFGTMLRRTGDTPQRKLDLLWPVDGPSLLHSWPDWSRLASYEYFSAFMIGVYVIVVIGFLWAFLFSFYFCASTVVYFLLRRDVDGTALDEVQIEDEPVVLAQQPAPVPPAASTPSS